jgi:Protein of unknown function (DUF3618)
MPSVSQLEKDAERTRSQLVDALDEFRANLSPGQILDQLTEYAGEGDAGEFYRGLRYQMGRHPVPMVLVGAGIAWMVVSSALGDSRHRGRGGREATRRGAAPEKTGGAAGEAGSAASDAIGRLSEMTRESAGSSVNTMWQGAARSRDSLEETAGSVSDVAATAAASMGDVGSKATALTSDVVSSARDTVGTVADSAGKAAASAYGTIAATTGRTASAVGASARHMGHNAASNARSFVDFCRSEPLVLGSMGVAIGAVLGALLPPTQTEDYLMGEKSDRLKEDLAEMAGSLEAPTKGAKPTEAESGGRKSVARKKHSPADK